MSERPTVMISSTAFDLPEHREQVRDACLRSGFAPHEMMENLNAMDADAIEASLAMVDKADVYIGIFAFRYGYVPDGKDFSVTEIEYQRAVELKKPRLLFFMHDDHPITAKMVETGAGAEKLAALKDRAGKDRVARFFKSSDALRGDVIGALHELKPKLDKGKNDPAEAAKRLHRRTPIPLPPTPYIAHPYTLSQTRDLVGRRDELNALTDWVTKPDSPAYGDAVFCFVAIGGMGKSALTWKWFNDIAPEEMPDLAGRLWWSFYESDAHFENFLNRALCYVGEFAEDDVRDMTWQDREALLLQHLNDKPYLLVLDGLERILIAYNRMDASSLADDEYDEQTANTVAGAIGLPASAAQSFTGQHRLRQAADPRADHFLRKLAQVRNSRALISTRLYPLAIQLPTRHSCPGCFPYFLMGLSDDDAVALWRQLDVSGFRQELTQLFNSFDNHPLLVQALAGEIARDKKTPGDFTAWRKNNPSFDPTLLPVAQVKSHILQHALTGVDEGSREALTSIVALRAPATYDTLEALLVGDGKAFEERQALDQALSELEDRGLIGWDREANRYDAHPIVRGVTLEQLETTDRKALFTTLDTHFASIPIPSVDQVVSFGDLHIAIERYHSLVELERYEDAFSLFSDHLNLPTSGRLVAFRERTSWLSALFPKGIEEPPASSNPGIQIQIYQALAFSYRFSGRPGNALKLLQRCRRISDLPDPIAFAITTTCSEGMIFRETGALYRAHFCYLYSLIFFRSLSGLFESDLVLRGLGRLFSTIGQRFSANICLARSQKVIEKRGVHLRNPAINAYIAEKSLWQDDMNIAKLFADRSLNFSEDRKLEIDSIRASLLEAKAALKSAKFEQTSKILHAVLTRTRSVNAVEYELPTLIALAELDLKQDQGAPSNARARLDEVWEPAEEGPYPLQQADAYNVLADICLAEDDKSGAIGAATKAYRAAWCDGPPWAYHWGLEKAKAHLQSLSAPFPDMRPFDESKFEPLPEVEINPKDDYWVDPSVPLEALLDLDTGERLGA